MTWKPGRHGRADRMIAKHEVARERRIARRSGAAAASPQDALLRAAKNGEFEALVAKARPAQPIKMVMPEEREAELRAAGQWPEDKPRPEPKAEPPAEETPPAPEPGMPTEPTPGMLWAEEHIRWRPRGPSDLRARHEPGQCLVEYDPIEYFYAEQAELDDEDDEW
jgi:hypothetical protein